MVDQSPPSRTPRSTPAVYTGACDHIRAVFAESPDAIEQELSPGYFSFNSGNGRCGRCQGAGFEKVEMQFLCDLYVNCPECEGKRFRPEPSTIRHNGKTIHDVLDLTVSRSHPLLPPGDRPQSQQSRRRPQNPQPKSASATSGSASPSTPSPAANPNASNSSATSSNPTKDPTLLILDEPTTGLHFDDINLLLQTFQRLVNEGHSLLVIEHNLEVIKCADWILDLGPEAGDQRRPTRRRRHRPNKSPK